MEAPRKTRFAVQLPLCFSGEDIVGAGTIVNLSSDGCAAVVSERVSPGCRLSLSIQLPEQETPLEIDLAVVRWTSGKRFGLEFLSIRQEMLGPLQRFVRSLEADTELEPPRE
jgi:hypothetical protein